MKTFYILSILILLAIPSKADYGAYQLPHLISVADFAAIGKIVKVDKNYFYLEVKEYILSSLHLDTLAIIKFEDWSCATRYQPYKIGQTELVFFRKSNYFLDEFELFGYGAGDEFELPIFGDSIMYQAKYPRKQMYSYSNLVQTIREYDNLVRPIRGTSKQFQPEEKLAFSQKSDFHKKIIEYSKYASFPKFDISPKGVFVNLEKNYLYEDYENKIYLSTFLNQDSIFLVSDEAEIRRVNNYFVIKPRSSNASRWINVMWFSSTAKDTPLLSQRFDILELPEPSIYFGYSANDTIYNDSGDPKLPRVAYFLDTYTTNESLEYELLAYDYIIIDRKRTERFKVKSENGTKSLKQRLARLKVGNRVTLDNIRVLYPDHTVRKLKKRTYIVAKP